jgi:hypothetical protein
LSGEARAHSLLTAVGRVSPVGEFAGFNDSIEYFFALAPVPSDPEFQGVAIYQADVVEFTSGCAEVAASVVYLRTGKVDPETGVVDSKVPVSTLTQVSIGRGVAVDVGFFVLLLFVCLVDCLCVAV